MGVRRLLGGIFAFSALAISTNATAANTLFPPSLPVTIIHREVKEPSKVDQENAPVEHVEAYAPSGTLHLPVAPQDREKLGLRIQPILEAGDQKMELPWRNASDFADYINRIPTQDSILLVHMEDGSWARGALQGLHVDLMTEKLYVPFQVWELERSSHGIANADLAVIDIPLEELQNRVFRAPTLVNLPVSWKDQQFVLNQDGFRVIPIVVLAFEGSKPNLHQPGPLAPYIPGYKNKDHSAIIAIRFEIEDTKQVEIGLYRVPVALLRTLSRVDIAQKNFTAANYQDSVKWLANNRVAHLRFNEQLQDLSADERHERLQKDVTTHFAVSPSFDLAPESCSALIVRRGDAA